MIEPVAGSDQSPSMTGAYLDFRTMHHSQKKIRPLDALRAVLFDLAYLILGGVTYPLWGRKQRGGWAERFGRIEPLPKATRARLLIHAVSVGEVNLIRGLVRSLAPEFEIVVTTTTDTGMERARALFSGREPDVFVRRYPLDFSRSVRRFLDLAQPDGVALAELEIWPNFLRECRRRGVPVSVVNGRLSDRSHKRYALARPLAGGWFQGLALCAVQDEQYRTRFVRAGAREQACVVAGNMKWDTAEVSDHVDGADALATRLGVDTDRPLIVAGSTAPGEHELLLRALPDGAQLLCAPRRPEWFDEAANALPGCVRFSRPEVHSNGSSRLFLLDTLGELRKAYALADVVVVGRSFGELFGSDPMEPAALGKAVVIGPAIADFRSAVASLREADGIVQSDVDGLAHVLADLIADDQQRARLGRSAQACVRAEQGATKHHADLLRAMLRDTSA